MNFLIIYVIVLTIGLTSYLFSSKLLTLEDFNDSIMFLYNRFDFNNEENTTITYNSDEVVIRTGLNLKKDLRHLEFIGHLESYIDTNKESILKSDYLNEIEDSKVLTQLSVLKSTFILNSSYGQKVA